jgi:hypothetical protein
MQSTKDIVTAILSTPDLTNDNLNNIIDAVKFRRSQLGAAIKNSISRNDNVEFRSKTGRVIRGFVTNIAIKYATVETGLGRYKVPLNMLTVVDKATV